MPHKEPRDPDEVFVPTRAQRNQVCILVASEWTLEMISNDMGLTQKCLKRFFKDELANGKEQVHKRALATLAEEGLNGRSINALKTLVALTTPLTGGGDGDKKEPAPKALVLGKKQIKKIKAAEANTGIYATPTAPGSSKVQ